MAQEDPPILGRPFVLWQLHRPGEGPVECVVGEQQDGRVRVRVVRGGVEQATAVFDLPAGAVAWADAIERAMRDHGWTD